MFTESQIRIPGLNQAKKFGAWLFGSRSEESIQISSETQSFEEISEIPREEQIQGVFEGFAYDGVTYALVGSKDDEGVDVLFRIPIGENDETRHEVEGWKTKQRVTIFLSELIYEESIEALPSTRRKVYTLDQKAEIRMLNDKQRRQKREKELAGRD